MVSVIIPIYNSEKYLQKCIDSITAQTYSDLEIILVDDGSTDCSGTICDDYQSRDNRITVIHQKNCGQAEARNNGLAHASGQYIYFQDSDDLLYPEAISHLDSYIKQEQADIVLFDAETVFEDFNDKTYSEDLKRRQHFSTQQGAMMLSELLSNQAFLSCPYLHFFSREFLENIKFHFPKLAMHEDECVFPSVYVKAHRIAHLHEVLYIRRLRANSVMSKQSTALSISCLASCICSYLKEWKHYPIGCSKSNALIQMLRFQIDLVMHKYAQLNPDEKRAALPALKEAAHDAKILPNKGFLTAKLKLSYPAAFCLCRKILLPVKKRFFH